MSVAPTQLASRERFRLDIILGGLVGERRILTIAKLAQFVKEDFTCAVVESWDLC
jgi:hypothetical protein